MENSKTDVYLKKVSKGAAIVFFGLIISNFLGYLTRMLIVRLYGVEDYGLFSLGNAIVGIAVVISMFGMQESVVRFISYYLGKGNLEKVKGTILSALKISLPISIVISIFVILFSDVISNKIFHEPRLASLLWLFALIIPLSVIFINLISSLRGFQRMEYKVYAEDIGKSVVVLFFAVVFYFVGLNIEGIILSYLIGFIFAIIFAIYYFKKIFPLFLKINTISMKGELFIFSWPLLIAAYIKMIMSWTDTIILGVFNASYDVGLYNIALPTAGLIYVFALSFRYILTPVMSEIYAKKKYLELKRIYKITCKWIFLITFPFLLIIFLFSNDIITFLFGTEAANANIPFIILSIGYFALSFIGSSSIILLIIKKTKITMINTIIATTINFFLNILLIPKPIGLGIIGAAIATSTSLIILSILHIFFCYKYTKLHPFQLNLIKGILCSIFSFLLFYFLIKFIIINIQFVQIVLIFILFPVFILFYFLLLLKTNSLDKNDTLILKTLEMKLGIKFEFLRNFIKKFIK